MKLRSVLATISDCWVSLLLAVFLSLFFFACKEKKKTATEPIEKPSLELDLARLISEYKRALDSIDFYMETFEQTEEKLGVSAHPDIPECKKEFIKKGLDSLKRDVGGSFEEHIKKVSDFMSLCPTIRESEFPPHIAHIRDSLRNYFNPRIKFHAHKRDSLALILKKQFPDELRKTDSLRMDSLSRVYGGFPL